MISAFQTKHGKTWIQFVWTGISSLPSGGGVFFPGDCEARSFLILLRFLIGFCPRKA